jgi:hypothetical protein
MTYCKCFTKPYTASVSADRSIVKFLWNFPYYISEVNRPNLNASNFVSRLDSVAVLMARGEGALVFVNVAEIGGLLLVKDVILHHVVQIAT